MVAIEPQARIPLGVGAVALAAGLLAFAVHVAFGLGGASVDEFFATWVYNGLLLGAAILCFARAALVESERFVWTLVGLGLTAWTGGEIYYWAAFSEAATVPIPSPADACYLAFYAITYVALVKLIRARVGAVSGSQWLDGVIVASAVAAVAVAIAMEPIVAAGTEGGTLAIATNLAYPIGDLALLTLVVTASAFTNWRPGASLALLGFGFATLAVSDGLYLLQSANGTYVEGGILDLAWPLGALLIAASAWVSPSAGRVSEPSAVRMAMIPALAGVVSIATLFSERFDPLPLFASILSLATLLCVIVRMGLSFRQSQASLAWTREVASTDALTGLGNRRRLMVDLEAAGADSAEHGRVHLFALFDLDGFKGYNDAFGHPAGDALLTRLGNRLEGTARDRGAAYRLGGDEFCILVECTAAEVDDLVGAGLGALSANGDGFSIGASQGSVLIPSEASDAEAALQLADQRMYANKSRDRVSAGTQSRDVLVTALRERRPTLHARLTDVAAHAVQVADELELSAEHRDEVARAAQLHDTGKMAIPDAILNKPGPLDEPERDFVRRHTLIGERIIASAPALVPVARLVRSSHERWDGEGYPDGLQGEEIPLGSRIVSVCDAFEAMIADRPYGERRSPAEALAELRRCAGTQFDPAVVAAFEVVLRRDGARASQPARS
jgi:two-component system cell cycle response regulator